MFRRIALAGLFILLAASLATGYCIETDCEAFDFQTCDGWSGSRGKLCRLRCICAAKPSATASFLDAGQPGLITVQSSGRLIVSAIVPGSPAEKAGFLAGDEIEYVNGIKPGSVACPVPSWNAENENKAHLEIRRSGRALAIVVDLVPIRALLDSGWIRPRSAVVNVAYHASNEPKKKSFYAIGIQVAETSRGVTIAAVFRGSPAESAGIRIGDQIVAADGKSVLHIADFSSVAAGQSVN